jgi:hypothetical protein
VFSLSAPAPVGGLSVAFTFTGTATWPTDLSALSVPGGSSLTGSGTSGSGVAFFAAGASTVTFTLATVNDGVSEGSEAVTFSISAGTGYAPRAGQSTFALTLYDLPSVTMAVSPATVPGDGASALVFTFTRTGSAAAPLAITFAVGGTATLGTDFTAAGASSFAASAGALTFAAGASTAAVTVTPAAGLLAVGESKTVVLSVTAGSEYLAGSAASATGTIVSDKQVRLGPGAPGAGSRDWRGVPRARLGAGGPAACGRPRAGSPRALGKRRLNRRARSVPAPPPSPPPSRSLPRPRWPTPSA